MFKKIVINPFHSRHIASLILFCWPFTAAEAQPTGYNYGKVITIDHTKVSGSANLTDFPLLINITDNDLKTSANGGHVENTSGYDIIFTSSDCLTPLSHQVERYNPLTGQLVCWVKIPSLSYISDTYIHMYYGNTTINSTTSSTSTWSNTYLCVQHLSDDPGATAPQMKDGTANFNDGTSQGSLSSSNVVAGKIGNSISFDETDDAIVIPDFDYTQSFSISFWFNVSDNSGTSFQYIYSHGSFGFNHSLNIYFGENTTGVIADRDMLKTIFQDANDATNTSGLNAGTTYIDGSWHYYTISIGNVGGATIYIDGTQVANVGILGGNAYDPATDIYLGSRSDLNSTRFYGSLLDEFQITNAPRSADWIATEYANQNNPSAFYSLGVETLSNLLCAPLPIYMISFNGRQLKEGVQLEWTTLSEINNDYFTIEKSMNAVHWMHVAEIEGSGTTINQTDYSFLDKTICEKITYYRLKQTDFDGTFIYSDIISVIPNLELINYSVFPNPCNDVLFLQSYDTNLRMKIHSIYGKEVASNCLITKTIEGLAEIDLSGLQDGVYIIEIEKNSVSFRHIIIKNRR